ncbi:MAG TPA: hypothetical protein VIK51_09480 [Vicinamibacteria bacterium]
MTLMATVLPETAIARPRVRLTGQVEITESYDDNLFPSPTSPVRQSDFSYRVGPRLGLAYATRSLNVFARYGREAEAFAWRPELDSARARQEASLDVGWSAGRVLRLEAGALYEDTSTARDLNVVTGLETGRLPAQRFSTRASASLRLGRLTALRAEHAFSRDRISGFPTVAAQVASVVLQRRRSGSESATMTFSERQLGATGSLTRSHVLTLGWSRQVTPGVHFEVKAGPRLSDDGTVGPEVLLGVRGNLGHGDVTLEYTQTEATAVAHLARLDVQGVSVTLHRQLHRDLWLSGGPGIFASRDGQTEAIVYRAGADLVWRLVPRVTLTGSYQWSRQEGNLAGPAVQDIPHNTFALKLAAGSARREGGR